MRFRPTLYAAILGSSLLGASTFLMAAGDEHPPAPPNPEYAQWSHFKPGSYVTLERKILEHRDAAPGVVEAMARRRLLPVSVIDRLTLYGTIEFRRRAAQRRA